MAYTFAIEPESYAEFENEAAQLEKCKEWGLLSEKAAKAKTFLYKGNRMLLTCSIVGYVDPVTAVIAFENGQKHCIHPSYLKEMQSSAFNQRSAAASDEPAETEAPAAAEEPEVVKAAVETDAPTTEAPSAKEPPKAKEKKGRAPKLELPEDKVGMIGTVKEFTTVPNPFTETEDEVVIYESVAIVDPAIEVGEAWSSHSATLKKLELAVGDTIEFEAKIIAKKLSKHPVPYKINNPSKIQKRQNPGG
ncbi:hypothetical protein [Cohnella caldifontis]|uniref:hypothetical protein n=1 Tax=Cohnella caldifontis TaxID=3027471 RepID=UPI0023EB01DB|nr:hypothetical protein [Cohnella sp. YIM B05605]